MKIMNYRDIYNSFKGKNKLIGLQAFELKLRILENSSRSKKGLSETYL